MILYRKLWNFDLQWQTLWYYSLLLYFLLGSRGSGARAWSYKSVKMLNFLKLILSFGTDQHRSDKLTM